MFEMALLQASFTLYTFFVADCFRVEYRQDPFLTVSRMSGRSGAVELRWKNIAAHKIYGPLVRLGPNRVSISDYQALKTIYRKASMRQTSGM